MSDRGETYGGDFARDSLDALPAELIKRAGRYRYCCGVCQRPKERSHFAARGQSKGSCTSRLLSPAEKAELIHGWMQEQAEGKSGRVAVVAQERMVPAIAEQVWQAQT